MEATPQSIERLVETSVSSCKRLLNSTSESNSTPKVDLFLWSSWFGLRTFGDPALETMVQEAARFVLEMRVDKMDSGSVTTRRWLSLLGNSGTGKTMVAKRIWHWFQDYGRVCDWHGADNHFSRVRSGSFCHWRTFVSTLRDGNGYGKFEDYCKDWLLILDEIGMEQDRSGFATDKLAELLSRRVGKWTLMTSNLKYESWADVDTRISSRMMRDGGRVVHVNSMDYALRATDGR